MDIALTPQEIGRRALREACERAGGQKPLADKIKTTQSQVWYWLERSKKGVPAEFVLSIESETGVSRHVLRPDLYPPIEAPSIVPQIQSDDAA